jgi:hypothetical protein
MLQREALANDDGISTSCVFPGDETSGAAINISDYQSELDGILFKSERMYRHNIARINYTTYDVRRSQDVINPNTSHRDIILLANQDEERCTDIDATHPFLYARVLGIYHVNVVYNGPCRLDYAPRRFYFFWVRWFEYIGDTVSWRDRRLDSIHFPPTANSDAFGFVDPRDVLRGCHIVQVFKHGKVHLDGIGLSRCASDAEDWCQYSVNRYLFIGSPQTRFTAIKIFQVY